MWYSKLVPNKNVLSAIFAGAAVLHFVKPEPYDAIVPAWVPGSPRTTTTLSGAAEALLALGLHHPKTRKLAGYGSAALLAGVFPANIKMAQDWWDKGTAKRSIAIARLPLQWPLIQGALNIANSAK